MTHLRHLHLPSIHPHYVPYSLANRVQEHLRRQHLDFKDSPSQHQPPPPPTLISFSPAPIYTLGRRQTTPLALSETARLTAPLTIPPPPSPSSTLAPSCTPSRNNPNSPANSSISLRPRVLHSPRGGLTTYHGPGQIVLWPILDLKSPFHRHFTVKCYARLLESTTIALLSRTFNLKPFTTADPGVWVRPFPPLDEVYVPSPEKDVESGDEFYANNTAKIAALGVHLRRYVTALGTAINVGTPTNLGTAYEQPSWESDEADNPWKRIVACGLEGKGVTSVAREVELSFRGRVTLGREVVDEMLETDTKIFEEGASVGRGREWMVARAWAGELAERIGLGEDRVEAVWVDEAVGLMEDLVREVKEDGDEGEVEDERKYLERMRELASGRVSI
ncbi:hypothetical protein VTI74DRAFT_7401 [Chaetomium olivicolor]